jgi:hypothetical protein
MGYVMKKIAVNVVKEINMEEAHNDVVNFLFSNKEEYLNELKLGNIQINYFVCHSDVKEEYDGPAFENSEVVSSLLVNEDTMFNNIDNGTNTVTLSRNKNLFKHMYRSYINSLQIHKRCTTHLYDMVINYSNDLKSFKIKNINSFKQEADFFHVHILEPKWLKVNYNVYACSPSTFFKVVNFWYFLSIVSDQTFRVWDFIDKCEDSERFVLPMWLNMQSIKVRDINEL